MCEIGLQQSALREALSLHGMVCVRGSAREDPQEVLDLSLFPQRGGHFVVNVVLCEVNPSQAPLAFYKHKQNLPEAFFGEQWAAHMVAKSKEGLGGRGTKVWEAGTFLGGGGVWEGRQ